MKIYTIPEIKKQAAKQHYKMAALEDSSSKRLQPFNKPTTSIASQLNTIEERLNNDLFEDGFYFILMAQSISSSKNPDRYKIQKGTVKIDANPTSQIQHIVTTPVQEVLTYEAALSYQQTISDLRNEIAVLKLENNNLKEQIDELEQEQELSENTPTESNMKVFLNEAMPSITPVLDRYFDLEEKKLNLKFKQLDNRYSGRNQNNGNNHKSNIVRKKIPIKIGSQQHLELIDLYYKKNMDDKLSDELDKLEDFDFNLYKTVCEKLGIEIEDDEDNNGKGGNDE